MVRLPVEQLVTVNCIALFRVADDAVKAVRFFVINRYPDKLRFMRGGVRRLPVVRRSGLRR